MLSAGPMLAQQTTDPPHIHREGNELEKLNYFVGSWVLKAKIERSATSDGGEFQQTQTVEWMKGEHFLVSHANTKGSLGETFGLVVTGFDPKEKKFAYHSFHSTGVGEHGTGTVDGKTWTWVSEPPEMDVRLQRRFVLTELSPEKYSFLLEITSDGKTWTTAMQGEAQKQQ
jgi:Protein of unknown function (DUF1579)